MEHGAEPPLPHFLRQDCRRIGVGVARMDHKRQVELPGERDMPPKDPLSDIPRGAIIVIIEARLADPDAFGMFGERPHGVEVLRPLPRRLMRMCADREENVVVPLRNRGDASSLRHSGANGDHPLDAGRSRALDDCVEVVGEVGKIEVAVAVDESHSATPSPLREEAAGRMRGSEP